VVSGSPEPGPGLVEDRKASLELRLSSNVCQVATKESQLPSGRRSEHLLEEFIRENVLGNWPNRHRNEYVVKASPPFDGTGTQLVELGI
jgi:hypothetical protein